MNVAKHALVGLKVRQRATNGVRAHGSVLVRHSRASRGAHGRRGRGGGSSGRNRLGRLVVHRVDGLGDTRAHSDCLNTVDKTSISNRLSRRPVFRVVGA